MDPLEVEFEAFEKTRPADVAGDSIWALPAYRISRFLAIIVRQDLKRIRRHSFSVAEQLERAIDSIGNNITEGYSRLSGRERARYYETACGSARESRDWYVRAELYLGSEAMTGRFNLLNRVIRILTAAIPQERDGSSERRIRDAHQRKRSRNRRSGEGDQRPKSRE